MKFYYRDLIGLTDLGPETILKYMRDSLMDCKKPPAIRFFLDEDLVPYTTYSRLRKWLDKKSACRVYLSLAVYEGDPVIPSFYELARMTRSSHNYIKALAEQGYICMPATVSETKARLRKHPDVYMLLNLHKKEMGG